MRNHIILNGTSSATIQGLLIQSLPPISKPLVRTQVEEIDGRDGDIVTKLGYSAYDKRIEIGLHGDFDINEVIAFFDSEGQVTFSNEPDKYYNYQIIQQIDFERLVRYRTAIVTFHVQPFKYSTTDERIDLLEPSGNLLTLEDSTQTENGITVDVDVDDGIHIYGTGTATTEFYVDIETLLTEANKTYYLYASANGTSPEACSMRLISDSPSTDNSFAGTYVTLANGETEHLSDTRARTETFNYLWFYITGGIAMDFTLNVLVTEQEVVTGAITNSGNTTAKPKITIYGEGTVDINLNDNQIFSVEIGDDGYITIDAMEMQAYSGSILQNRNVTGDYDNLVLPIGQSIFSWSGTVTHFYIDNYSRWI